MFLFNASMQAHLPASSICFALHDWWTLEDSVLWENGRKCLVPLGNAQFSLSGSVTLSANRAVICLPGVICMRLHVSHSTWWTSANSSWVDSSLHTSPATHILSKVIYAHDTVAMQCLWQDCRGSASFICCLLLSLLMQGGRCSPSQCN